MGRHLSMSLGEGESMDDFAERMASKINEHFGGEPQEAPEATEEPAGEPAEEPAPEEATDAETESESSSAEE